MAPSMLKAPSILRQSVKDQQKPAEEGHFPVAMWLRLEELGLVRRWSITLSRKPDTGRYGLGLNEGNEVTVAPEGSGLMLADIIIGCEGERLGEAHDTVRLRLSCEKSTPILASFPGQGHQ